MAKMMDLIRQGAVPPNILRAAAHGTLALVPEELIEVMVTLAEHAEYGPEARTALAQFDIAKLAPVLGNPATPHKVLNYFLSLRHRRPEVMSTLIANPAVSESTLAVVAETASRSLLELLLVHERTKNSPTVMMGMATNSDLQAEELRGMKERLKAMGESVDAMGNVFDYDCAMWVLEHAAEIAAEAEKGFELAEASEEEKKALAGDAAAAEALPPEEKERISTVQKIARLKVGERVQLAMKGTKDERFVLIRDGSKVVSLAVLESPKVSDGEVEMFASMKNVQEEVLRGIARKRRFMKNYSVARALVNNPRTPLDLALGMVSHMLVNDLKGLSMNKNISDTVRKLALKMFRDKSSGKGGD